MRMIRKKFAKLAPLTVIYVLIQMNVKISINIFIFIKLINNAILQENALQIFKVRIERKKTCEPCRSNCAKCTNNLDYLKFQNNYLLNHVSKRCHIETCFDSFKYQKTISIFVCLVNQIVKYALHKKLVLNAHLFFCGQMHQKNV